MAIEVYTNARFELIGDIFTIRTTPLELSIDIHNVSQSESFAISEICICLKYDFLFFTFSKNVLVQTLNINIPANNMITRNIDIRHIANNYGRKRGFTAKVIGITGEFFESEKISVNSLISDVSDAMR